MSLNVSLTPELEQFIADRVESGMYTTASEVVREGLRLLKDYDELRLRRVEELRSHIDQGWKDSEEGHFVEADVVRARITTRKQSRRAKRG